MDPKVVGLTTEERRKLRWAIRARALYDTPRPVLEFLLKIGRRLVCADGFRAHSIPVTISMAEMQDGAYRVVNDPGKNDEAVTIQLEESLGLPNLSAIYANEVDQLAAIAINSQFLRKSLKGIGDPFVVLRIFRAPGELDGRRRCLTIESLDGECVALIMSGQVGDLSPQTRRLVDEPVPEPAKEEING